MQMRFYIYCILSMIMLYSTKSYSQNYLFFSKNDLLKYGVNVITNLKNTPGVNCTCINIDTCAHTYIFKHGILKEEFYYSTPKEKIDNENIKFTYIYYDTINNYLKVRNGDLENGLNAASTSYFRDYTYRNGLLYEFIDGDSHSFIDTSNAYTPEIDYTSITRFFYSENSKLNKSVSYEL